MLACVLRPSDRDPASVVSALIKRLLVPLRRAWPRTKIIVRADSGFCRPRVLQRLERWGVSYIIGLQKNSRLAQQVELAELALAEQYAHKQTKQRMFGEFEYAAGTWDKARRVIARLEHGEQGANPRFIVTDLPGSAKALYERRYCARGEAENRIKEAQLDLFGRRASCQQSNEPRLSNRRGSLQPTVMDDIDFELCSWIDSFRSNHIRVMSRICSSRCHGRPRTSASN